MQRQTIAFIWIGGIVLALALYVVGPDRFMDACLTLFWNLDYFFRNLLFILGTQAFNVVRAVAIALFVVFWVLGLMAARRGLRAGWALTIITVLFLILVWRPESGAPVAVGRWFIALLLSGIGALVMTQRLMAPPRTRPAPPGWPPFPGQSA